MILKCTCTSHRGGIKLAAQYQDNKYGKQMRVHNQSGNEYKARCTVCGDVKGYAKAKGEEDGQVQV